MRAAHTVLVLRDAEGSIYGGYTDVAWHSRTAWVHSNAAFLFCLESSKAPAAAPFKMPLNGSNNGHAILCGSGDGATFGNTSSAWDLAVNWAGRVTCNIGTTYTAGPTGSTISRKAKVDVGAMEVWQLADA